MQQYSAPYTPLLVGFYVLLTMLAMYQIILIYWHGHKLLSFNFGFLWLCVLFCVIRVIFWLVDTNTYATYHTMYWLPINIQFGMFYLVMLYIMRLVQRSESSWDKRQKNLVFWISVAINAAFLIATVVWLVYCASLKDDEDPDPTAPTDPTCDNTHAIFAALCFLVLGLSLLYYGVKLHIIASREATARDQAQADHRAPPPPQVKWGPNESRFRTEAICFVLLTVFITRAVFDLVQLDIFNSHPLALTNGGHSKDITNPAVFWMYVVWEIFPTALMLFFFGTAVQVAGTSVMQKTLMQQRLTITETTFSGAAGKSMLERDSDEEDEDEILERGASNALWPFSKEVADVAFGQSAKNNSLEHGTRGGILDNDDRYESPCEREPFASPLTAHVQGVSVSTRGYHAAMGVAPGALYLAPPVQAAGLPSTIGVPAPVQGTMQAAPSAGAQPPTIQES